jgi:16S rRNA (cytosine967-C5)-methyltransferase
LQELENATLPEGAALASFDAVLIDVPCSNTGVIRRRPDVKLRLKDRDIARQAAQQSILLEHAARWVRPGGRLVYSTCSLEKEENTGIVDAFCGSHPEWKLEKSVLSLPWEAGHDGGGAFLLTREIPG